MRQKWIFCVTVREIKNVSRRKSCDGLARNKVPSLLFLFFSQPPSPFWFSPSVNWAWTGLFSFCTTLLSCDGGKCTHSLLCNKTTSLLKKPWSSVHFVLCGFKLCASAWKVKNEGFLWNDKHFKQRLGTTFDVSCVRGGHCRFLRLCIRPPDLRSTHCGDRFAVVYPRFAQGSQPKLIPNSGQEAKNEQQHLAGELPSSKPGEQKLIQKLGLDSPSSKGPSWLKGTHGFLNASCDTARGHQRQMIWFQNFPEKSLTFACGWRADICNCNLQLWRFNSDAMLSRKAQVTWWLWQVCWCGSSRQSPPHGMTPGAIKSTGKLSDNTRLCLQCFCLAVKLVWLF